MAIELYSKLTLNKFAHPSKKDTHGQVNAGIPLAAEFQEHGKKHLG